MGLGPVKTATIVLVASVAMAVVRTKIPMEAPLIRSIMPEAVPRARIISVDVGIAADAEPVPVIPAVVAPAVMPAEPAVIVAPVVEAVVAKAFLIPVPMVAVAPGPGMA